jgi:glucose-fructose oxidoreductase
MSLNITRRKFLGNLSSAAGGFGMAALLPGWQGSAHKQQQTKRKWGIALVGLGYYSTQVLAPALAATRNVKLTGIVTGTPDKAKRWSQHYGIPNKNIYNYQTFETLKDNPDIDIIYVVLPNSMHKEYTIRAARAGKHVICEKPMALSAADCREMIAACRDNHVALSIGYRMQFEPHTQEIIRLGKQQVFGEVEYVTASAGFKNTAPKTHWKLQSAYGGGVTMDMGVYCIQAARYCTALEPLAVSAQQYKSDPIRFDEVDEIVTFQLIFPDAAVANCLTSFHSSTSMLHVISSQGWYELNPFQTYSGIQGRTQQGTLTFPQINQQATQMDEVAWCIENDQPMRVPGEEGLRDIKIVEAIFRALQSNNQEAI